VLYAWFSFPLPDTNNAWKSRNLGILVINYADRADLSQAMRSHAGTNRVWGATTFYFIFAG